MDKPTIATEVLLKLIETDKTGFDAEGIAAYAWEIADAMQDEADKRKPSGLPDALKEEWQPDWSQAPEWAKWWSMDADSDCYWFENKPELMSVTWFPFNASEVENAPSFNYQGNWKESLRERPNGF